MFNNPPIEGYEPPIGISLNNKLNRRVGTAKTKWKAEPFNSVGVIK